MVRVSDQPVYITHQPVVLAANPFYELNGEWSTGLFDCFDDIGECKCILLSVFRTIYNKSLRQTMKNTLFPGVRNFYSDHYSDFLDEMSVYSQFSRRLCLLLLNSLHEYSGTQYR
jgi:hypothetical protein